MPGLILLLVTGSVFFFALVIFGVLIAKVGIPSFVVTLAAFLAFQGLLLVLLGGGINISIRDEFVISLNNDNIPVLSWLLLRGRCRNCGVRISPQYPLVELATA